MKTNKLNPIFIVVMVFLTTTVLGQSYQWDFSNYQNGPVPSSGYFWTDAAANTAWNVEEATGVKNNIYDYGLIFDHNTNGQSGGKWISFNTLLATWGNSHYLTSSQYNIQNNSTLNLSFWYHFNSTLSDTLEVEQYINGSWVTTNWFVTGHYTNTPQLGWKNATINLDTSSTKIRFRVAHYGSYTDICIDDIQLYEPKQNDLAAYSWDSPLYGSNTQTATAIEVTIMNRGTFPQDSFIVKYSIDGGITYVSETCFDTIPPGDTIQYQFTTQANFSIPQLYTCLLSVNNIGDSNSFNDTLISSLWINDKMSGHYTLGSDSMNDFQNFHELKYYMELFSIGGPTIIDIDSGTYNMDVVFENVKGASSTNTIKLKGLGAKTKFYALKDYYWSTNYIFELDGAKFFILDSLYLFKDTSSLGVSDGIKLKNSSDSNVIQNCIFNSTLNIAISTSSSINACTISNNLFTGCNLGISFPDGSDSQPAYDNHFNNNRFINVKGRCINIRYQDGPEIIGNYIYNKNKAFQDYEIEVAHCVNRTIIRNNKIISYNSTGGIAIYYHNRYNLTGDTALIYNNSIFTSDNGINCTSIRHAKFYYNSISISGPPVSGNSAAFTNNYSIDFEIKNNHFISTSTGRAFKIFQHANYSFVAENNNFFTSTSFLGHYNTTSIYTLSAWKDSTGSSSVYSIDPNFIWDSVLIPTNPLINDSGIVISTITKDINGSTRSLTHPDIGAYEFISPFASLGPDTTICESDTLELNTHLDPAYNFIWASNGDTLSTNPKISTDSAGIYTVEISYSGGTIIDTIAIGVNPNPVVNLGSDTSIYWTYGSVLLNADNQGAIYYWNNAIGSQTKTYDKSNLINSDTNQIFVNVIDSFGCSGTDTMLIIVVNDINVEELESNNEISIYPNPSNGNFYIKILEVENDYWVNITTLEGRRVFHSKYNSRTHEAIVKIENLAKGVYILSVINDKFNKSIKVIVN